VVAVGVLLAAIVAFNTWKANLLEGIRKKECGTAPDCQCRQRAIHRVAAGKSVRWGSHGAPVRGVDVTTEVTGPRAGRCVSNRATRSRRAQVLVELNADPEIAQQHALEAARRFVGHCVCA